MNDPKVKPTRFNGIRWIVFIVTAIPLLALITNVRQQESELKDRLSVANAESKKAQSEMLRAKELQRDLSEKEEAADFQRDQLRTIYRKYRVIEDFAPNPTDFVVFTPTQSSQMNDTLHFSVPEGDHVFLFQMTKTHYDTKEVLDVEKLQFPLQSRAGYRVKLDLPQNKGSKYRDPRQLTLKIESTSDSFDPVSKDLLEPFPPPSGSSTGSSYVRTKPFAFPNQVDPYKNAEQDGLLLNKMRWNTRLDADTTYRLDFEMRLQTAGPKTHAPSKHHPDDKSNLTYAGGGKYIEKANKEPADD